MKIIKFIFLFIVLTGGWLNLSAWPGMEMPVLHVEGRFLVDENGNRVNLHGFGQTYSPWFNEQGSKWTNYDVEKCLAYNKGLIDDIMEAGWKMNFLRLHMDPYWSNTPGVMTTGENDISAFDFSRFRDYLNKVFIPMAEYAISKGLYVVMRPPGVCPEEIAIGDEYHKYLKKVWGYISTEPALVNNPHIMFELANEPVRIKGTDGVYSSSGDACYENLTIFFQEIVDLMRNNGCNNILWVPGTGYQSQYAGFVKYPIVGKNIGFAVHVYPGWYGSDAIEPSHELGGSYGGGFSSFSSGWASQILPAAQIAPIMVTEMDWAPSKYGASWGKSITGKMMRDGFGGNFKILADMTENVSWMIFTGPELLAKFKTEQGNADTFLTDPEACPWPVYHWFKEYAGDEMPEPLSESFHISPNPSETGEMTVMPGTMVHYEVISECPGGYQTNSIADVEIEIKNPAMMEKYNRAVRIIEEGTTLISLTYNTNVFTINLNSSYFPFTEGMFNPSIWETGTFNATTHEIKTGTYGFAGWHYSQPLDLSGKESLIAELEGENNSGVSLRIFDIDNYWSDPAIFDFGNEKILTVNPKTMISQNGRKLDQSHIFYVGFWSTGAAPFKIKNVFTVNGEAGVHSVFGNKTKVDVYTLQGLRIRHDVNSEEALENLPRGIYIVNGKKMIVR